MSRPGGTEESLVHPLRDANRIVELISSLTQQPEDIVLRRLQSEYVGLGTNVAQAIRAEDITPYVWSQKLEKFYEQTDAFLYETVVWNLTHAKCELRTWMGDYLRDADEGPKQVLTFGDGLGFDAYYLASIGHNVTYFEVSLPCSKFAQTIFDDGDLAVEVLTDPSGVENRLFDTIVCLDVLEHVPDPGGLVQWLSGLLKPNGRLIVSAPFFLIDSTVQTHLRSNRHLSGDYRRLYEPAGLTPVDGRLFWNPIVLQKCDPKPIPRNVRLGSSLLKAGRFWTLPFSLANKSILKKKHALNFKSP